jgi:hypothetical protein
LSFFVGEWCAMEVSSCTVMLLLATLVRYIRFGQQVRRGLHDEPVDVSAPVRVEPKEGVHCQLESRAQFVVLRVGELDRISKPQPIVPHRRHLTSPLSTTEVQLEPPTLLLLVLPALSFTPMFPRGLQ